MRRHPKQTQTLSLIHIPSSCDCVDKHGESNGKRINIKQLTVTAHCVQQFQDIYDKPQMDINSRFIRYIQPILFAAERLGGFSFHTTEYTTELILHLKTVSYSKCTCYYQYSGKVGLYISLYNAYFSISALCMTPNYFQSSLVALNSHNLFILKTT